MFDVRQRECIRFFFLLEPIDPFVDAKFHPHCHCTDTLHHAVQKTQCCKLSFPSSSATPHRRWFPYSYGFRSIEIGAVCASAISSTVDKPANVAYAPNLAEPENIGRETLMSEHKIVDHPSTSTLSHFFTTRLWCHFPRSQVKIAVDAFHKFLPSSRPLNKTSAPLPCGGKHAATCVQCVLCF